MAHKKVVALGATLGAVLMCATLATPANAEPVANSYAIVGSDTLEDVVNGLVNGTNITGSYVRSTVNGNTAGSYDATGTVYVQTKTSGVRFGRPNGSGDGIKALSRSIDGAAYTSGTAGAPTGVTITDQVDIARSSSNNSSNTPANTSGDLLFVPFGRDAIAYAYSSGSDAGLQTLTASQLKSLYECTVRTINGVTVTPVIPQAGSGTRKDFLSKIGSSETGLLTLDETGGCVQVGQEHDATVLTAANMVMPMSASRWVAMNTGASYNKMGTAAIAGVADVGAAPVTGTGTSMVPNPTYYANSTWGRDTYLVVEYARVNSSDPKYDAGLATLMDPTIANSLANTSSVIAGQAGSVKKKYGFLAPSSTTPFRATKAA